MAALSYSVSFHGAASPTLRAAFSAFELETVDGTTFVRCPRGQLNAVITIIQDLGLELFEVRMLAERDRPGAGGEP